MGRRSLLGLVPAALGGTLLYLRRGPRREYVELYFGDGSVVSLEKGSPEAGRLLAPAREILEAAR